MKITVAGVVKEVQDNITISELIAQDNVEFLYFMGGGQ